jgi:ketosteroid isomerase-like protein
MQEFSYNIPGEVALSDDPKTGDPEEKPAGSQEIEEFFQRLPATFRWPKPNAEAVAAAVEAIQRMSGGAALAQQLSADDGSDEPASACAGCGAALATRAQFCGYCGLPKNGGPASQGALAGGVAPASAAAQHHSHHHYHHVMPGIGASAPAAAAEQEAAAPRGRAPSAAGSAPGGRAEASARQVVQDWAQACNTRHIDDLVELYAADATVIRSSVPPVRSLPAIREFLLSMLEAGLGDVEMESLRLEVMGEIAIDLGRCKMLVPVAVGKRREERGKYLVVLVRQPVGTWKIFADCWSSDLPVAAPPGPEGVARKGAETAPPVARKTR